MEEHPTGERARHGAHGTQGDALQGREAEDPFRTAVLRFEREERIASRVKLVAALQLLLGGLGLAAALLVAGVVGSLGFAVQDAGTSTWLGTLGALLGGFGAALSLPALAGGVGLFRRKAWARRVVVVLAACELFWVPIGTVLGGVTLAVLLPESVRRYFEGESILD